jgi:hypothetical protein
VRRYTDAVISSEMGKLKMRSVRKFANQVLQQANTQNRTKGNERLTISHNSPGYGAAHSGDDMSMVRKRQLTR